MAYGLAHCAERVGDTQHFKQMKVFDSVVSAKEQYL